MVPIFPTLHVDGRVSAGVAVITFLLRQRTDWCCWALLYVYWRWSASAPCRRASVVLTLVTVGFVAGACNTVDYLRCYGWHAVQPCPCCAANRAHTDLSRLLMQTALASIYLLCSRAVCLPGCRACWSECII